MLSIPAILLGLGQCHHFHKLSAPNFRIEGHLATRQIKTTLQRGQRAGQGSHMWVQGPHLLCHPGPWKSLPKSPDTILKRTMCRNQKTWAWTCKMLGYLKILFNLLNSNTFKLDKSLVFSWLSMRWGLIKKIKAVIENKEYFLSIILNFLSH